MVHRVKGSSLRASLLLLVTFGLAVACTATPAASPTASGPSKPETKPETKSDAAAQPKVSRLVMSVVPPGVEDNEPRFMSSPAIWIFRSMWEYPIAVDPNTNKLVPGLATEWNLEPDGLSYRFKLRRGVQFHKGWGEMNAQDFEHAYRDIIKEDSTHGQSQYWRQTIRAVEIVNDYELIYHLNRPDGQFLAAMSESQGGMEIRSKAHADSMGTASMESGPPAGTGPYQFKERVQGSYVRLEKVPYQHWRANAEFPEFEFRFQREASTRLASLLSGESHMADLPQDLLAQAEKQGFKVIRGVFPGVRVFGSILCCYMNDRNDPSKGPMNPENPMWDIRVRKALNKAVNREELNKAFFASKGQTMLVNHFQPTWPGWNQDWEKRFPDEYGYDPAKARALLADAGQPRLKLNLFLLQVTGLSGGEDIAETMAGYWRAIGVDVELSTIDFNEQAVQARALRWTNHAVIRATGTNQWTGVAQFNSSFGLRGGGVEEVEAELLLRQLTTTLDDQQREELWRKLGEQMFDRHMNVPLFWLPAEAVANPRVVGEWLYPGSLTGTWTHLYNIKPARG